MENINNSELLEFRSLMTAIQKESILLKKVILTEEEEKEEIELLNQFNNAIQEQIFSTLNNMNIYQLRGWRVLVDE